MGSGNTGAAPVCDLVIVKAGGPPSPVRELIVLVTPLVAIGESGPGSVTEYSTHASGNVHPILTISGGLNDHWGIAFDASGALWVANDLTGTVVEYRKSGLAKASPASAKLSRPPPARR
jgi:hypothetical protein